MSLLNAVDKSCGRTKKGGLARKQTRWWIDDVSANYFNEKTFMESLEEWR